MASPETVAQLFARKPIFDVIVFDEASQCRLEESLPVLARGRRVVVAGDEQQLPPTRFFESTLDDSDEDEGDKVATDQDLFERQQSKTEDLLNASLQLQVRQAYLDVHYRSKNADLIEFSNRYFYKSRLQPIPSHPDLRAPEPPIKLYRVDGVFEKSANEVEAKKIVEIVKGLLARKDPPSIGIACMNVQQRDEILQELDDAAAADEAFGKQLDAAKQRMGKGSFEGLFVKNLENVQGDERDEMIISTTYGPDKSGKFYQRFGPLQMSGGGRRLNVLVTRAARACTSSPAFRQRRTATCRPFLRALRRRAAG
ncbi:MAG: DEAD/DEAH box helicase [Tepidisphaeraceae bacterium]